MNVSESQWQEANLQSQFLQSILWAIYPQIPFYLENSHSRAWQRSLSLIDVWGEDGSNDVGHACFHTWSSASTHHAFLGEALN